jgi:ketosteroid isomerase-like protein
MTDSNRTAALPGPVAEYVRACNAFDPEALSAVFAEDALVNDIRREFRGRPAIRRWIEREIVGDKVTLDVREVRLQHGTVIVDALVDGEYDKTGLPAELVLTHYFNVADDHVTLLIITQNSPAPAWSRS